MIDLYYWTTPNGHKVTMFLEETGLPYRIVPVNIRRVINSNRNSWRFLRITAFQPSSINAKGWWQADSVFESGAILLYLAEKTGMFSAARFAARSKSRMAILANGRSRADGGPKSSLQPVRT